MNSSLLTSLAQDKHFLNVLAHNILSQQLRKQLGQRDKRVDVADVTTGLVTTAVGLASSAFK